jgi:3-hydroxyisobutyrate dehydrogenase
VRIGFVGLGSMGAPMAERLAVAGHRLVVVDADPAAAERVAAATGARLGKTPREAGEACDLLITMLPDSAVVEEVLFGSDGAVAAMPARSVVVEMSSGVPSATVAMAARTAELWIDMIDAPVSGGVPRARTGELTIMVGGPESVLERVRPVLDVLGAGVRHTGDVGSAHAMKALNNLASAGGFLIGLEVLLIGKRFGLAPETVVEVLDSSTGMTNSTRRKFRQFVLSGTYDSGFGLDLMVKDLAIAMGIARDTSTSAPFSALCAELWTAAARVTGPGHDHTEMARFSELLAGDTLVRAD